ncbi:hypothetical protein Lpar_1789 [Legionella parisiensis]|uniref:Uncharacterized protein n=1 Tax=Legionella parisiensis TaxID=45071 RepID=A0A1E5JVA3_9GAMM|nr:hypothetical protein Lpar_1789 [Legionella parisiensis]OEH48474.1 hypothetical protein lpari_00549 [Legionella parisiensis]STX77093.1 Uncharacterised protein [Legionella parisiensis]
MNLLHLLMMNGVTICRALQATSSSSGIEYTLTSELASQGISVIAITRYNDLLLKLKNEYPDNLIHYSKSKAIKI